MSYTILQQQHVYGQYETVTRPSLLKRSIAWLKNEERINHVAWVGISITVMSAVLFPLTMAIVLLNGAYFGLIIAAMASLALVVVTNLAALPTTYTIPFLFLGGLIDLAIIVTSFFLI